MSSRDITPAEVALLKASGMNQMGEKRAAHVIALDGVGIIVNPANPITSLTSKQIEDVFAGRIQDWILLGGDNGKIQIYLRDEESGTRGYFQAMAEGCPA